MGISGLINKSITTPFVPNPHRLNTALLFLPILIKRNSIEIHFPLELAPIYLFRRSDSFSADKIESGIRFFILSHAKTKAEVGTDVILMSGI